jgi:thiol-disulfide isomerase/thioredoxin
MSNQLNSFRLFAHSLALAVLGMVVILPSLVIAQDDRVSKVLSIRPRQANVDIDIPDSKEIADCKVSTPESLPGYVVSDPTGRMLRRFIDSNKDDRLDQWSYYKDGIEVYRDIDANFDNKADQSRWMGTEGTRWGIDRNQDGKIDEWRQISAEEVAEEVFRAIQDNDPSRFELVLISDAEIDSLKLGKKMTEIVKKSASDAKAKFPKFVVGQRKVSPKSEWVHFGTSQPSLIPEGNDGLENDVVLYDHASAVFRNGEDYEQVALGTIMKISDGSWRLLELPELVVEGQAVVNGGLMFPMPEFVAGVDAPASDPVNERLAVLFKELDTADKNAVGAQTPAQIAAAEKERALVRIKLVENAPPQDRVNWLESLADTVTDACQRDRFPDGLQFLQQYYDKLKSSGQNKGLDYVSWRMLNTKFSMGIDGDRQQRSEATSEFIEDMEEFAKEYGDSEFGAECFNNLGMHYEVSDRRNPDRAIEWYKKCAQMFANEDYGKKAAGAVTRLTSAGKPIKFVGKTLDGRQFDLERQKDKIVVIHYWETGCDFCIEEFEALERLSEKYKDELILIGANIDLETSKFESFMREHPNIRWTQLHEPGGVEKSPLAHQLGPSSLPLIVLIDQEGNLVEAGIPADELDREIQRLIRKNN